MQNLVLVLKTISLCLALFPTLFYIVTPMESKKERDYAVDVLLVLDSFALVISIIAIWIGNA